MCKVTICWADEQHLLFNQAVPLPNGQHSTELEKLSVERQKAYKRLLETTPKNKMLQLIPDLHEQAFEKINCLDCAACCKNYSPRFKTTDIKRLSKSLGMKESQFIEQYLRLDQDGDYVTKSSPVHFWDLIMPAACMKTGHPIVPAFPIQMKMYCLKNSTYAEKQQFLSGCFFRPGKSLPQIKIIYICENGSTNRYLRLWRIYLF